MCRRAAMGGSGGASAVSHRRARHVQSSGDISRSCGGLAASCCVASQSRALTTSVFGCGAVRRARRGRGYTGHGTHTPRSGVRGATARAVALRAATRQPRKVPVSYCDLIARGFTLKQSDGTSYSLDATPAWGSAAMCRSSALNAASVGVRCFGSCCARSEHAVSYMRSSGSPSITSCNVGSE